ncbi:unnamed protein product, partial [Iphiclides podalirius]
MKVGDTCEVLNLTELVLLDRDKLPDGLKSTLENIAEKEGYATYDITNRTISVGGSYMAVLYVADIKGKVNNKEEETSLFIKHAITQDNVKIMNVSEIYWKELFVYGELSKIFEELENEAVIPPDKRYKLVKFYKESNTDAIILQNLAKEGYSTVYRMGVMPLKFAELSVQQLARFHALSFVIEQKRPEYFKRKIKSLKTSQIFNDDFNKYCENTFKLSVSGLDERRKRMLEGKFPEYLELYKQYIASDEGKIKCLCHGDYRMNNILMKTTNGIINEVIPVDFQLLYYGLPMIDLIYLIYSSTDKEFRDKHLKALKDLYFDTMENYLQYFAIDINSVYPRKQMEADYDDCLKYGLQIMLLMMPYTFSVENYEPDLNKSDLFDITLNLDRTYYDRLNGVIDDMIEYGKL